MYSNLQPNEQEERKDNDTKMSRWGKMMGGTCMDASSQQWQGLYEKKRRQQINLLEA